MAHNIKWVLNESEMNVSLTSIFFLNINFRIRVQCLVTAHKKGLYKSMFKLIKIFFHDFPSYKWVPKKEKKEKKEKRVN